MTDKLELSAARGHRAKALLEDDILKSAFDTLRADYLKFWEATTARDTDARERLWQAVQILGKVQTHLETVVSNGNLADFEIRSLARGQYPAPQAVA